MEHLPEFITNHLFLFGALAVVLVMLFKAEYEHQVSRAYQLNPTNAIRLMNNDDTLVLDVREPSDYGSGHITNATNIPLSALKGKLKEISAYKNRAVLIYCGSGNLSGRACKLLQQSGFTKVHNITGGLHGWQDANLPLTKK